MVESKGDEAEDYDDDKEDEAEMWGGEGKAMRRKRSLVSSTHREAAHQSLLEVELKGPDV